MARNAMIIVQFQITFIIMQQVGACIVNPEVKKIVAVGHSHMDERTVPEHLRDKINEDFNLGSSFTFPPKIQFVECLV